MNRLPEETWPKIYLGQDPNPELDPDQDISLSRSGSRQKSTRSTTLRETIKLLIIGLFINLI
jgi:hypothetical protein